MLSVESKSAFRRKMSPSSSGSKESQAGSQREAGYIPEDSLVRIEHSDLYTIQIISKSGFSLQDAELRKESLA
jgi:hypothetical protein